MPLGRLSFPSGCSAQLLSSVPLQSSQSVPRQVYAWLCPCHRQGSAAWPRGPPVMGTWPQMQSDWGLIPPLQIYTGWCWCSPCLIIPGGHSKIWVPPKYCRGHWGKPLGFFFISQNLSGLLEESPPNYHNCSSPSTRQLAMPISASLQTPMFSHGS